MSSRLRASKLTKVDGTVIALPKVVYVGTRQIIRFVVSRITHATFWSGRLEKCLTRETESTAYYKIDTIEDIRSFFELGDMKSHSEESTVPCERSACNTR